MKAEVNIIELFRKNNGVFYITIYWQSALLWIEGIKKKRLWSLFSVKALQYMCPYSLDHGGIIIICRTVSVTPTPIGVQTLVAAGIFAPEAKNLTTTLEW